MRSNLGLFVAVLLAAVPFAAAAGEQSLFNVETGDSGDLDVHPASLRSESRPMARKEVGTAPGGHARNFFDCVRSRAEPAANARVMRSSHVACLAAAAAWQVGRKLAFDPMAEEFVNDAEANRLRSRALREPWRI